MARDLDFFLRDATSGALTHREQAVAFSIIGLTTRDSTLGVPVNRAWFVQRLELSDVIVGKLHLDCTKRIFELLQFRCADDRAPASTAARPARSVRA